MTQSINLLFAYKASINYTRPIKYQQSYRLEGSNLEYLSNDGLKYFSRSNSMLFNGIFYAIDNALNVDYVIPPYDPNNSYIQNSVCILNEDIIQITQYSNDGTINYRSLNQREDFLNEIPKLPYHSIESLEDSIFNGNEESFVPKDSSDCININYIKDHQNEMIADYLEDPNVDNHKNDKYHIQVYNSDFLIDSTPAPDAFKFNFPKKLIFINTRNNNHVIVTKNIFDCFPDKAQIKICDKKNDGVNNFKEKVFLQKQFNLQEIFFAYSQTLEITDLGANYFIIENNESNNVTYGKNIFFPKKYNILYYSSRAIPPLNVKNFIQIDDYNYIVPLQTDLEKKQADLISYNSCALNFGRFVYLFSFINPISYGDKLHTIHISRFDNLYLTLTSHQVIKYDLQAYADNCRFNIIKNYGQFPDNTHMLVYESRLNWSTDKKYAKFLTFNPDTLEFSISEVPDYEKLYAKFNGTVSFKKENILYVLNFINSSSTSDISFYHSDSIVNLFDNTKTYINIPFPFNWDVNTNADMNYAYIFPVFSTSEDIFSLQINYTLYDIDTKTSKSLTKTHNFKMRKTLDTNQYSPQPTTIPNKILAVGNFHHHYNNDSEVVIEILNIYTFCSMTISIPSLEMKKHSFTFFDPDIQYYAQKYSCINTSISEEVCFETPQGMKIYFVPTIGNYRIFSITQYDNTIKFSTQFVYKILFKGKEFTDYLIGNKSLKLIQYLYED
jgi:hypothetical protein